jgi:hypothetical protein
MTTPADEAIRADIDRELARQKQRFSDYVGD